MAEKQYFTETRAITAPSRPTITLPPRPSMDNFFSGVGLSPGPMTLVSSFFSDNYANTPESDYRSFSQLLAGAIASSPMARSSFFTDSDSSSSSIPSDNGASSSKQQDGVHNNSGNLGFKQSRPMNLVVAHHSPLFTVPPGLSPSGLLNSPGFFSPPQSPFGMSHQQALAQVTAQAALNHMHLQAQYQPAPVAASTELLTRQPSFTPDEASQQQMLPSTSQTQSSMVETSELSHCNKKQQLPIAVDKPSEDGYNWRKYGQKPIKGSEYPRSYYKCTHLNCPVKKKVERSSDGQITEIIYKGQHNHEQSQPSKRAKDSSDQNASTSSQSKSEFSFIAQAGSINKLTETIPAHSVSGREHESMQADPIQLHGSSDSDEAGETRAEDGDEDEPNPKRRQTDVGTTEVALPQKTVTESKIIVQTRSEVDLLDDGYRWRKYGQKVVKGNPHPSCLPISQYGE
ncbi:probable WRKY transcription factor 3 isoform X2 [Mercurialis annua]|uniref:probable WRKY transcription factor 3 isoform X2 n=1 Tax=Mercurialis annua TaxID=3986 RepID=UPI0021605880|nr:probable WRKY transcription factor 3 isoform X2 [Mercurialis annua]